MSNIYEKLLNKEAGQQFYTGTVITLSPLTVKIFAADDAISVVPTSNLAGLAVGDKLIFAKIGAQFFAIGYVGSPKIDCIEIKLTSDQSITTTDWTIIEFDTEGEKVGSNLSFSAANNSIVIGAGISEIEIYAQVWNMQYSTGYSRVLLYKNATLLSQSILPPVATTGEYWTTHTLKKLISVAENDEIKSKMVFGAAHASNIVEGTQAGATYLTVTAIKYDFS